MDPITIDSIAQELSEKAKKGIDVSPREHLDYASKINVLILDLDTEIIEAEMAYNSLIARELLEKPTITAEKIAKASPEYKRYITLRAKRKWAERQIMLGKKRVELSKWDG